MTKDKIRDFKNWVTNILSYVQLIPILSKINKNDIVIDCGANVGVVSGYFASKGAKVYSFEPDPNAFSVLQKRFENTDSVKCINKGVWKEDSKMKLYFHTEFDGNNIPWSVGSSIIKEKANVNTDHYIEVDLVNLSEFIAKLNSPIKVLRIDIEGAEIEVLNKLIDTRQYEKIGKILVETHEAKITTQLDELKTLKGRIKELGIRNINLNWL